jgi:hypothetical protein
LTANFTAAGIVFPADTNEPDWAASTPILITPVCANATEVTPILINTILAKTQIHLFITYLLVVNLVLLAHGAPAERSDSLQLRCILRKVIIIY